MSDEWQLTITINADPIVLFRWWINPANRVSDREQFNADKLRDFAWQETGSDDQTQGIASWVNSAGNRVEMRIFRSFNEATMSCTVETVRTETFANGREKVATSSRAISFKGSPSQTILTLDSSERGTGEGLFLSLLRSLLIRRRIRRQMLTLLRQYQEASGEVV